MAAGKSVHMSNGMSFDTVADGQDYYRTIRDRWERKQQLSGGDFAEVDALYRDYCSATEWKMPGEPVAYYTDLNTGGTVSFYVRFDSGKAMDFSFMQAVKAIANRRS